MVLCQKSIICTMNMHLEHMACSNTPTASSSGGINLPKIRFCATWSILAKSRASSTSKHQFEIFKVAEFESDSTRENTSLEWY